MAEWTESGHPESSSEVDENARRGLTRRYAMNKALIGGAVVDRGCGIGQEARTEPRRIRHSRGWIDRMPDNAPPKWMFQNISAIRENTDRILELLDSEHKGATPGTPA